MSHKGHILKSLVEQRLSAAAEEIFGLFERTIAEYEEELSRSKEENQRQRELLESVWNLKVLIHPPGSPVDVASGVGEEVPREQEEHWSLGPDPEEPEPLHIKEEQEGPWTNQQPDVADVPPTRLSVKREDEGEGGAPSSPMLLRHGEENAADRDGASVGGSGPSAQQSRVSGGSGRQSPPGRRRSRWLHKHAGARTETALANSKRLAAFWREADAPRGQLTSSGVVLGGVGCEPRPFRCSECGKTFGRMSNLTTHRKTHGRVRQFECSVCGKIFGRKSNLATHMKIHTGEKSFSCAVCQKRFRHKCVMQVHMTTHTGVRAFACGECGRTFAQKPHLVRHMKCHDREKPVG